MITNQGSGTRIDEVAEGIYRISTPVTTLKQPPCQSFTHATLVFGWLGRAVPIGRGVEESTNRRFIEL